MNSFPPDGSGDSSSPTKTIRKKSTSTVGKKMATKSVDGEIEVVLAENNDDENNDEDDLLDDEAMSSYRDPPQGHIRYRPSKFAGIPATVFVEYPPELGMKRNDDSRIDPTGSRKQYYKSYWGRTCIRNAFMRCGFTRLSEENTTATNTDRWTVSWSKHLNGSQMKELNCLQKVCHYPNSWCVGRKDRLCRTINIMKRIHGREHFDFHPDGFILPGERDALFRLVTTELTQAKSSRLRGTSSFDGFSSHHGLWIVKPVASSCGRGIRLKTSEEVLNIPKSRQLIVQRYLAEPYLIDGKKFDLRIYILVTGVDPLRVYVFNEGLTRISTSNYSLKNIKNRFAHLTNYSINKKSANFKAAEFVDNDDGESDVGDTEQDTAGDGDNADAKSGPSSNSKLHASETEGFKWSLAAFKKWLSEKESPEKCKETFAKIYDVCLKTMIAAESEITPKLHSVANYRTNCFELFGCDVILDSKLTPHILEVNVSPSLMGSSPLDKKIKGSLIADVLHLVGTYPHDTKLLKKYSSLTDASAMLAAMSGLASAGAPNPFEFSSLSKLMASQDAWRKNPSPMNIDMSILRNNVDQVWPLLLMIEDELDRRKSTQFHILHPRSQTCIHYNSFYRHDRFSDHLLARWVMEGGSTGKNISKLIPKKYVLNCRQPLISSLIQASDSFARTGSRKEDSNAKQMDISSINTCYSDTGNSTGTGLSSTSGQRKPKAPGTDNGSLRRPGSAIKDTTYISNSETLGATNSIRNHHHATEGSSIPATVRYATAADSSAAGTSSVMAGRKLSSFHIVATSRPSSANRMAIPMRATPPAATLSQLAGLLDGPKNSALASAGQFPSRTASYVANGSVKSIMTMPLPISNIASSSNVPLRGSVRPLMDSTASGPPHCRLSASEIVESYPSTSKIMPPYLPAI